MSDVAEGAPRRASVVVVGAGIWGLCTAFHLRRLGVADVVVLEQFEAGHRRASSHGASRITRSTYEDPRYVAWMLEAHGVEWPRLEAAVGRTLLHRMDGCFFGPAGGSVEAYVAAVRAVGADVDEVTPREAGARYAALRFDPGDRVLLDRTGGLIAAADTLDGLRALLPDGTIRWSWPVTHIEAAGDGVLVGGPRGEVSAEAVVVTAGAWAARLLPEASLPLRPVRQTVAYYEPCEATRPGALPVWAYLGAAKGEMLYGLPAFGAEGVKVARYLVDGDDDPDGLAAPSHVEAQVVDDFVAARMPVLRGSSRRLDTCLFAMAPGNDFILRRAPHSQRVVIGAGGSGHGFKFGPLVGRMLAELATA